MTTTIPGARLLVERAVNSSRVSEARLTRRAGRLPFFRTVDGPSATTIKVEGRVCLNFASNNYLDLANDPRVVAAVHEAVDSWGAGLTGSRLLNGSTTLHAELERELADFYGKPAALVFPTGYTANLGLTATLLRPGETVAVDHDVHASGRDGVRLAQARAHTFAHNDPADLGRLLASNPSIALCLIEGVYSMRGDRAPVEAIARVCREHDVMLVVDEAHGLGTTGPTGAGAAENDGVLDLVDAVTVTFSKSLGGCGGAVVGSDDLIEALRFLARPFMFTASNTPGSVAGALSALRILRANPGYVTELAGRVRSFGEMLDRHGVAHLRPSGPVLIVTTGSDAATVDAWELLWNRGIYSNAATSPALPPGRTGIRVSLIRTHDDQQIERAAAACAAVSRGLR